MRVKRGQQQSYIIILIGVAQIQGSTGTDAIPRLESLNALVPACLNWPVVLQRVFR